mgnify:CR=1 FL=1
MPSSVTPTGGATSKSEAGVRAPSLVNKQARSFHGEKSLSGRRLSTTESGDSIMPLVSDGNLHELGQRLRSGSFSRKKKFDEDEKAQMEAAGESILNYCLRMCVCVCVCVCVCEVCLILNHFLCVCVLHSLTHSLTHS